MRREEMREYAIFIRTMNNVFWISSYNDPKRIALIIISIAIRVKRLFIGQFIIIILYKKFEDVQK